jgi:hypothetical protein
LGAVFCGNLISLEQARNGGAFRRARRFTNDDQLRTRLVGEAPQLVLAQESRPAKTSAPRASRRNEFKALEHYQDGSAGQSHPPDISQSSPEFGDSELKRALQSTPILRHRRQ